MVKNGTIKHPSQTTIGESLSELMGLEERVNKLSDFLSSIATWTFVNFMTECFTNPDVIESARPDDPQFLAFKKAVIENSSDTSSMLLDFGAGKGRLFEQIKLDYEFLNKINYSALEININFHNQLVALGAENVYSSYKELPAKKFDFILLCNVLHEIPIDEWVYSLNGIYNSLADNGFLLIIEAKILTKGEKIGEEGFILLDLEELKVLYGLTKQPTSIKINGKKDLITCAVLSKSELRQIDKQILLKTLKALQENTLKKIIALRKSSESKNDTIAAGRKNAFLSQLHINSQLAQINLETEN
jgi:SAM-dependent methyltransferase